MLPTNPATLHTEDCAWCIAAQDRRRRHRPPRILFEEAARAELAELESFARRRTHRRWWAAALRRALTVLDARPGSPSVRAAVVPPESPGADPRPFDIIVYRSGKEQI